MKTNVAFTALALVACAACSSSSTPSVAPATGPAPDRADGGSSTLEAGDTIASEGPPVARPMCPGSTVAAAFGQGCSAAGNGGLCTTADTRCGELTCVIDGRTDDLETYCTAACDQAHAESCPLGYTCTPQAANCRGAVAGSICARNEGSGCHPVLLDGKKLTSTYSSIFEGAPGELYIAAGGYKQPGALYAQRNGTWQSLLTWTDGMDASVGRVARSKGTILAPLYGHLLIVEGTTAHEEKPVAGSSSVYGVGKDGTFRALQGGGGGAYATVHRRATDGSWQESGPTRLRLYQSPTALGRGFVALCGSLPESRALCVSEDGDDFRVMDLPSGGTLGLQGAQAAGMSIDDFYIVLSATIFHYRHGAWAKEDVPAGFVPSEGATNPRNSESSILLSADGTPVFNRDDGDDQRAKITRLVMNGSCWRTIDATTPSAVVASKNGLAWIQDGLCTLPLK